MLSLVCCAVGLLLFWWVYIILIAAIKIDDPGPAFFRQKRVGKKKNGAIQYFSVLKFRTMKMDTPHDMPTHLLKNPEQYITRVGRILRKFSLDELPQVFNVLRGDMAFVGPRPALWNQFDLIEEREMYGANDVRPGITGWAQIHGRDELEISEKAKLDGYYVQNISLKMDLKCLFGTVLPVLRGEGVVEGGTGAMRNGEK
ncbi:MAG: sugar transferase [Butyricicoccus sp.]